MISFDFDRAKMRRRLSVYSAIVLGAIVFGVTLFHVAGRGWAEWAVLGLVYALLPSYFGTMQWVGVLVRGLKRADEAVCVNQKGLVDNASGYALGQLAWDEIEKMYPSDLDIRLFASWWDRMPVISKQRGVVVMLKDGVDFQRCLRGKPKLIQSLSRPWYAAGRRRWLFIPEMALAVTADELMTRLNAFYIAEMRSAA